MECVIPHLDFNSSINGVLKDSTGVPYFGKNTDTSVGTWSTNYLIALVEVIFTILLIATSPKRPTAEYWISANKSYKLRPFVKFFKKFVIPFPYHHRVFIALAFLFLGLAGLFSGIPHHEACAAGKPCTVTFKVLSNVCLCVSGAYFINFTFALMQNIKVMSKIDDLVTPKENGDDTKTMEHRLRQYLNKWMVVYLVVICIYIILAVILLSMKILSFSIYVIIGSALPYLLMVIVTGIYEIINRIGCTAARYFYFLLLLLSLVIAVAGFVLQMMLAEKCGIRCPVECPPWIPVPNFNHNAIFHIFAVVSHVFSGVWAFQFCKELESDMAPYYKRFEHR